MSAECRKQLRRRQKVIAQDYKADYGLTKACRVPIREFHCKQLANMDLDKIGAIDPQHVERTKLSSILLCLEGIPILFAFGPIFLHLYYQLGFRFLNLCYYGLQML